MNIEVEEYQALVREKESLIRALTKTEEEAKESEARINEKLFELSCALGVDPNIFDRDDSASDPENILAYLTRAVLRGFGKCGCLLQHDSDSEEPDDYNLAMPLVVKENREIKVKITDLRIKEMIGHPDGKFIMKGDMNPPIEGRMRWDTPGEEADA